MLTTLLLLAACLTSEPPPQVLAPVATVAPVVDAVVTGAALQAAADRAHAHEAQVEADARARMDALVAQADGACELTPEQQAALEAELLDAFVDYGKVRRRTPVKMSAQTYDGMPLPAACDDVAVLRCRDFARLNAIGAGRYGRGPEALDRMLADRAAKEVDLPFHAAWADTWLAKLGQTQADVSPDMVRYLGSFDPAQAGAE